MLVQNFTKIELTPGEVAEAVVDYVKKNKGITLNKNEINFMIKKETDNSDMFGPPIETYKFDGCFATTYAH